jgi:hypothetical protein
MNLFIRQHALYGLSVVLFSITGIGVAQDASVMPLPPLTPPMMGGPALGPAQIGVVTTGGMAIPMQESTEVVKSQPYQAQAVTEVKQTLADGSHITQTTTATVARDSDGRTVRIQKLGAMGPWKSASGSSQADAPTLTIIFDPVAQTHTDYTSDNKTAHVLPMPPLAAKKWARAASDGFQMIAAAPGGGGPSNMTFAYRDRGVAGDAPGADAKTESLGDKAIDGIPVTGTKTTNTIPAGTIGNDKDLVITRETWYSPDLKMVLQSTQIDPRFGETTYSLTNVQRSEPDSALFQVPAGYTVEKVPVKMEDRP